MPACSRPALRRTSFDCREEAATETRCRDNCRYIRTQRYDDDPAGLFRGPANRDLAAVQSHREFVRREKLKKEAGDNSGLQRRCPLAASLIASGHYPRKAARCHFESAADGPGFPSHSAVKEQPPPWPKNSTDCSQ